MGFQYSLNVLKILLIILCQVQHACSNSKVSGAGGIGEEIPEVGFSKQSGSNDQSIFQAYDQYSNRLNFIDTKNQSLSFSQQVASSNGDESWISGKNSSYFFGIEGDRLYIYRQDQERSLVNTFAGNIESYATSYEKGIFIFVDSFASIMMINVSESGYVESSWIGGSIINSEDEILAGDVLTSGHFLISTKAEKLYFIDIESSIATQSWVIDEIGLELGEVQWVGKVDGNSSHALVFNSSKNVFLIDVVSGTLLDQLDLSQSNVYLSKNGTDHIAYIDSENTNRVILGSAANTIQSFVLPEIQNRVTETKVENGYMLAVSKGTTEQYYKVRLSDGLVERRVDVQYYDKLGFTENYVVIFQNSPLGYIKLINFETREETIFSGFNLEALQK